MKLPSSFPYLKGFRYPRDVIADVVWVYHRFARSTADVEDLLAERGVVVSCETVRLWFNRFGSDFTGCIRRDRPRPNDKWHLDDVVISINGKKHWLWRAVDADGLVLGALVQGREDRRAAQKLAAEKLLRTPSRTPCVMVTDKPGSEGAARTGMGLNVEHRQHKDLNNRAKNAHLPTRWLKRIMKHRFTSARHLKRLVFILDGVANLCNCPRHAMSSSGDRAPRSGAIIAWREIAEPGIAA
jgi:putative transposase